MAIFIFLLNVYLFDCLDLGHLCSNFQAFFHNSIELWVAGSQLGICHSILRKKCIEEILKYCRVLIYIISLSIILNPAILPSNGVFCQFTRLVVSSVWKLFNCAIECRKLVSFPKKPVSVSAALSNICEYHLQWKNIKI